MERTAIKEELVAIAAEEIQVHLQRGKTHFEAARYTKALKEFETILKTAPGSIEARVWIRKAKEELTKPKIEAVAEREAAPAAEETKPKECVWMKVSRVFYRLCTHNYDCLTCEFGQMTEDALQQKLNKLVARRELLCKKK